MCTCIHVAPYHPLPAPGEKDLSMDQSEFDDKVKQLLVMGIDQVRIKP